MAEVGSSGAKTFDAYEYVGVIAPGAVLAVAIVAQWPAAKDLILSKDFSLGGFGIFLVCSFVLGHLVAAIGNVLERLVFLPVGRPSDWVRRQNIYLISKAQRERLIEKVNELQGGNFDLTTASERDWFSVTREIYGAVSAAGRAGRVDAFNRTYGLMRGIASALLCVTIWLLIAQWGNWQWPALALGLAILALYRMIHFGKLYANELFVQYIGCS